jgi:hypothetical protein
MAIRTAIPQPSGSLATRAGEAEAHRAGDLGYIATAVAFGTNGVRPGPCSCAVARRASFLTNHTELNLGAPNGLPEIDVQSVLQIGSFLGRLLGRGFVPAEPLVENILEIPRSASGTGGGRSARRTRTGA